MAVFENFCPNVFDCVINYNLSDYSEKHDELIEKAIISIKNQKLVFDQPFKTDINAHRTEYDLCKLGDKAINDIMSLVEAASNDYEKEIIDPFLQAPSQTSQLKLHVLQ